MKQSPYSIALADDFKPAQAALRSILTDAGYSVNFIASNGKQLIDELKQTSTLPHLCIIDVNMAPLNGIETCTAIKQIDPVIKVLAYTMNDDAFTKKEMAKAGADGFFVKGGNILLLLETIKTFADNQRIPTVA